MSDNKNIELEIYDIHKKYKKKLADSRYNVKKNNLAAFNVVPNHPFRAMLCGGSGSGKTSLMMNLLCEKRYYFGYFSKIFCFCSTYHSDDLYAVFRHCYSEKKNDTVIEVVDEFDKDTINKLDSILEEQKAFIDNFGVSKSPRLLFIFDDILGEKSLHKVLVKLLSKARHYNASSFVITQSYSQIPRSARLQFSNLFLFNPSPSEMEIVAHNHNNVYFDKKRMKAIMEHCFGVEKKFFHINTQTKKYDQWYRCGLDQIYDPASFEASSN